MNFIRTWIFTAFIAILGAASVFAQGSGSIGGSVTDSLGAVVPGATITAVAADGTQKQATANKNGEYMINGLKAGAYTVRAAAPKFGLYENAEVTINAGGKTDLVIVMTVSGVTEQVDVQTGQQVSTDPNENASATVLKDKDLEALPDDPDELAAALRAMAGAGAGPDGGQILIDGFSGGQMPPKEAIREIRINQNPFSAEYDRVGFGRIEILTKPGFDKFRGSVDTRFNDESLNSRNPYALNRAPSQTRNFGGFLSGPISKKKSSFFINVEQGSNDQNAVIAATTLSPSGAITRFDQEVRVPSRRLQISPRFDFALNDKNTIQARYSFNRSTSENNGLGGFTLPTRATSSKNTQHTVQMTESMIINPTTVNETRFQYDFSDRDSFGTTAGVGVIVSGAFNGGGSQIGHNFTRTKRWELNNATTTAFGKNSQHSVKFGARVRGVNISDRSESNYGGTFTFAGFAARAGNTTDASCDVIGSNGQPGTDGFISSIEQYRCKTLLVTDTAYNPNQFTLSAGTPLAGVSQVDFGPYFTDDWKVRQDLTLSFGLRYENQSNIRSNMNWAPRFGFAWSPGAGGAKAPKTVFRGGVGVFYDRFGENQTLRANRQNGSNQLSYLVTNNNPVLGQAVFHPDGSVTGVPAAAQLAMVAPLASVPYRIANDLNAPYSVQGAVSVERQLDAKSVLSFTYTQSRSFHTLRLRNINAPVCPDLITCPAGLTPLQVAAHRPDPTQGNVYQVESSGSADLKMLRINLRTTIASKYSVNGGYSFGFSNGTTDSASGPGFQVVSLGFPPYSYDLSGEYARAAFLPRHGLFLNVSAPLPWGLRTSLFVVASTGRPFNITTGLDTNYDSLFAERPTFGQLGARCAQLNLTNSFCNVAGKDRNTIIPRNYGDGPGSFTTSFNINKTWGFGRGKTAVASNNAHGGNNRGGNNGAGGNRGGGGPQQVMMAGGGGGPMMMMAGAPGGGDARKPYQLTLGVNVQNLFNTVNLNAPNSVLSAPTFGQYRSTASGFGFFGGGGAANRRIDLSLRFSF